MSKAKPLVRPAPTVIIHEVNAQRLEHRIILVKDGAPDTGAWASIAEFAFHSSGLYANAGASPVLPTGIFRISKQAAQPLSE